MNTRFPSPAPQSPPVTGASRKRTLRSLQAAEIRRAITGEIVLESTYTLPERRPPSAPSSFPSCPQRISSSAGGSLTIVNRMSEAAAASRGVFASFAPAATSSEARDAVRFHTVTEWPALSRFRLIGRPIRPSPIKPIFREGDAVLTKCLLTPTLRWSANHTQNMRLNCSRLGKRVVTRKGILGKLLRRFSDAVAAQEGE